MAKVLNLTSFLISHLPLNFVGLPLQMFASFEIIFWDFFELPEIRLNLHNRLHFAVIDFYDCRKCLSIFASKNQNLVPNPYQLGPK